MDNVFVRDSVETPSSTVERTVQVSDNMHYHMGAALSLVCRVMDILLFNYKQGCMPWAFEQVQLGYLTVYKVIKITLW